MQLDPDAVARGQGAGVAHDLAGGVAGDAVAAGQHAPRVEVGGWLQGAVKDAGKGRAAFFGEAAMFTAQVAGAERRPMGMNSPDAEQNAQFVLNLLHWLAGPKAPASAAGD